MNPREAVKLPGLSSTEILGAPLLKHRGFEGMPFQLHIGPRRLQHNGAVHYFSVPKNVAELLESGAMYDVKLEKVETPLMARKKRVVRNG